MKIAAWFGLCLLPMIGFSQSFYREHYSRNFAISGGTGTSLYFGEMATSAPTNAFKLLTKNKVRYSFVGAAEYFFLPHFSTRAELSLFRLAGSDKNEESDARERNLSFRSSNAELSLVAVAHLMPLPIRFDRRYTFNVHFFGGVGMFTLNPKTTYNGKTYALRDYQTEGQPEKYSWLNTSFPVGMGIRIETSLNTSLVIEAGYRYTLTDYIDDVSGVFDPDEPRKGRYPTPDMLNNDPLRIALSDRRGELTGSPPRGGGVRGNPLTNDGYFLFNIKYELYLEEHIGAVNYGQKKLKNMKLKRR